MPSHHHDLFLNIQFSDGQATTGESLTSGLTTGGRTRQYFNHSATSGVGLTGGGGAHNNVQPSITMTPLIKV